MKKIGVASIFVIGIMFFSTLAYGAIQGFYAGSPSTQHGGAGGAQQMELPTSPILGYRLSPAEFSTALSRGFTVVTYKYDIKCQKCLEELKFAEELVLSRDFQGQIFLEEIQQDGPSEIEVSSALGSVTLNKTDSDSVTQAFCNIVVSPPLGCVVG